MYSANNPSEEILRLRADNERLRAALKEVRQYVGYAHDKIDVALVEMEK